MNILRILAGAVLGFVAGVGIGLMVTAGYVATRPSDTERNPGARSVAPVMGIVAIPACALGGMASGIKIASKINRRRL